MIYVLPDWADVRVSVKAVELAVTRAEAKEFARVDTDSEDDIIDRLIKSATDWLREQGVFGVTETVQQRFYSPPFGCALQLQGTPIVSVRSVKSRSRDVDPSEDAWEDVPPEQRDVRQSTGDVWTVTPDMDGTGLADRDFRIDVQMGFGAAADVPDQLKVAINAYVAEFYENRDRAVVPVATQQAITSYRSHF